MRRGEECRQAETREAVTLKKGREEGEVKERVTPSNRWFREVGVCVSSNEATEKLSWHDMTIWEWFCVIK